MADRAPRSPTSPKKKTRMSKIDMNLQKQGTRRDGGSSPTRSPKNRKKTQNSNSKGGRDSKDFSLRQPEKSSSPMLSPRRRKEFKGKHTGTGFLSSVSGQPGAGDQDGSQIRISVNSSLDPNSKLGEHHPDDQQDGKKKKDEDSDGGVSSDVESMLRETDPVQRDIKQKRIKLKQMQRQRRKPLPKLSFEQKGWHAPLDQWIPAGRLTEIVSAVESIRSNLPHTRDRFMKQTYRQMLMVKKRERDLQDQQRQKKSGRSTQRGVVGTSLSQSSMDEIKLEDPSRVTSCILPMEKGALVSIRNYAYDEKVEAQKMGKPVVAGPKLNKFGRIAAGYVRKISEKRDQIQEKRRLQKSKSKPGSVNSSQGSEMKETEVLQEPKQIRTHIEIQMENEKMRHWIRKRNGRIYDEKIKNLITTADNGSQLLKHEITESEGRLAAIKLGKSLHQVIPEHKDDFFLTDKENYFLGDKRALRRQEKQQLKRNKTELISEGGILDYGRDFQTIGSAQELPAISGDGGFFLTEQPYQDYEVPQSKKGMVKIPDLLDSLEGKQDEPVTVNEMFATAKDDNFQRVYEATTDKVKGLFFQRVQSRHGTRTSNLPLTAEGGLRNQRANSMSTAAATNQMWQRSGNNNPTSQKKLDQQSMINQINSNSNIEVKRLASAISEQRPPHARRTSHQVHGTIQSQRPGAFQRNSDVNTTVSYDNSAIDLKSVDLIANPQSRQGGSQSQMNFNAKRLLKDARSKRAHSINNAMIADLENKKNRIKYLQNLHKDRMSKKKLDQAHGSKLFEGFSHDEMHEILIEMPELKKMQKDMAKLIAEGPAPPEFSNTQLIHLDSLHDIANRDKAMLLKRVKEQINQRKKRIDNHVNQSDIHYDLVDHQSPQLNKAMSRTNAAILKKFQQQTNDGFDEEIEPNFNFHDCLKQRLNIAENKQQMKLYETFKHEDFVHKIWDENGNDRNQDSERQFNATQQSAGGNSMSQAGATVTGFQRQSTRVGDNLNKMASSTGDDRAFERRRAGASSGQGLLSNDVKKQMEDEFIEFDHQDQKLLLRLVEVFEARQEKEKAAAEAANAAVKVMGNKVANQMLAWAEITNQQTIERAETTLKRPSKTSVTDGMSSSGFGHMGDPNQDSYDVDNWPKPNFLNAKSQAPLSMKKQFSKLPVNQINKSRSFIGKGLDAPGLKKGNSMQTNAMSLNLREKKRIAQMRKEYRKYLIDHHQKEYQRAFDALVGSKEGDMETVINGMSSSSFHREAREFLVTQGKFMTDEHLIHLKEDPKTILSLYRIFMLQYKTTLMASIDKKIAPPRKGSAKTKTKQPSMDRNASGLSMNEQEESDYSDDDFQDLLSNKQIEENIRVFFDRMHELVNPIDEQRLKLDSVQQIKSTVKTFYKKKVIVAEDMLRELDQMRAERPYITRVKRMQFNDPKSNDQANLHSKQLYPGLPQQQCGARMADVRLNAELFRLRKFKLAAHKTAQWYNQLAARILAEKIQDEPLVMYMLDQIKNVIETGDCFERKHYEKLMGTFDYQDSTKPEVMKVSQFLDQLLPRDGRLLQRAEEFSFQQLPGQENYATQQPSRGMTSPKESWSMTDIRAAVAETKPIIKSRAANRNGSKPPKSSSNHDEAEHRRWLLRNKTYSRVTFQQNDEQ